MTLPLLIKNCRIIDPGNEIDKHGSVFIDDRGRIARIDFGNDVQDYRECYVVDAEGLILCPGFIDLHCHLRQPGYEEKETIATGTKAAANGGFTTICCMPNTDPAIDNSNTIDFINAVSEREGTVRVIPIAAVTEGRKGENLALLTELSEKNIAGFSDDGSPIYDPDIMRQALVTCKILNLPVIEHCEVPELAGDGVINKGSVSDKLGLQGIPDAAEEDMVARDIKLARETGGWVHIAHASTAGSVELIRKGKSSGVNVTVEVTPHHLTLTEDEVLTHGSQAKVNPPLRTENDIAALIEGLNDGTIDIIATDHAPHAAGDKPDDINKAAFGISGFETALGSLMTLVHENRITLPLLIDKLTRKPAELLTARPDVSGTLELNKPADILVFDPQKEWKVDPSLFASKGKNTPLDGATLKGKVMMTLFKGKPVYKDESLVINKQQ